MKLERTVQCHPGEIPSSLAARLGAANGVPAVQFGRDMGIRLADLDTGDAKALHALSRLTGIAVEILGASAIAPREDGLWLGAEKLSLRNVSRNKPRVCPVCLGEDSEHGREARKEARPWFRVAWAAPFVLTCAIHRCLLVEPRGGALRAASDLPDSLRRSPGWIDEAVAVSVETPESPLEDWLLDRLAGRETVPGFLDNLPLYIAARLAGIVGAMVLLGKDVAWGDLSENQRVQAGAAGFPIAHCSLNEFLVRLYAEWSQTKATGAKGRGGSLMSWLQDSRKNPDFAWLRTWVREHAIDHLPLGPGDKFLGPVPRRSLHSIYSAAIECNVHPKRLRKLLIQEGIVSAEAADLTDARVVFHAAAAHELMIAVAEEIIGEEARKYLGMNRVQWDQIRGAKLIDTLFTETDETHRAYSRAGLDAFLASIRYVKGDSEGLLPVSKAAKFAVCGYVDVVRLLKEGSLDRVGIDPSRKGFSGILVDADEVKRKVPKPALPGLTARLAAKRIGVALQTVHALTANGDLPSMVHQTYGGQREARLIRPEDVDAFLAEYMPLSELAKHLGVERWPRHACRITEEEGVVPVFTRETRRSVIYRRAEVEPIIATRMIPG